MLNHIEELKALNLPDGQYAIFGSGPMGVRNIRDSHDIDVIVKWDLWLELKDKYRDNIIKDGRGVSLGNIEIFSGWLVVFDDRVNEMIDTAEIIEGLPFVALDYVIEWKGVSERDKDKRDMLLIQEYLKNEQENGIVKGSLI